MSDITIERADHVAVITLNRPDRLNAITLGMLRDLDAALVDADADRDVRAIVLTGAGRGFCAGLDLVDAFADAQEAARLAVDFDRRTAPILTMQQVGTPVLAAVNGAAAGYGVGLAINADIRVMARDASLVPATKRNLVPESGDTYLLPRLIGWERAARFYFLGEDIDGAEALRLGIVSEVADDGPQARTRALALAERIAEMPPAAVQAAKRMMQAGREETYDRHVHHVLLQLLPLFQTKDFAEAVAAWREGRPPVFTGE